MIGNFTGDGMRVVITPVLHDEGFWTWLAHDGRGDLLCAGQQRHRTRDAAISRARKLFSTRLICSIGADAGAHAEPPSVEDMGFAEVDQP